MRLAAILALPLSVLAQPSYTVDQAVAVALAKYAAVRVSSEKVTEAAQAINLGGRGHRRVSPFRSLTIGNKYT